MKAGDWEFKNRATVFGLIFGASFPLYAVDPENSAAALADALANRVHLTPDALARLVFAIASLVMVVAALLRTWASAYLDRSVVYASTIKSESLVADGPYRYVRNPLYVANVLMALSLGTLMSRLGMAVALIAMLVFCYRLIFREELELRASRGAQYQAYCERVPRLWPALRARIGKSARQPAWAVGFKAENWCWGVAASSIAFAITLKVEVFFVILAASILLFWATSRLATKKQNG